MDAGNVFPYTGNKSCIYCEIADMMPDHDVYIEPCCGSAEVFFRKAPAKKEVINDYNGDLVNFFRVLQNSDNLERLVGRLFLSGNCEDLFRMNRELLRSVPNVTDDVLETVGFLSECTVDEIKLAAAFYENQVFSFSSTGSSYAIRGTNLEPKLKRLCTAHIRLRQAAILHRDYRDVIRMHAAPGAFIFLDPPYVKTEGMYQKSNFDEASHRPLFDFMLEIHRKFDGECKFMITYNDCPLILELAHGCGFQVKQRPRPHGMSKMPDDDFIETIITNYDAEAVKDGKPFLLSGNNRQMSLFEYNPDY